MWARVPWRPRAHVASRCLPEPHRARVFDVVSHPAADTAHAIHIGALRLATRRAFIQEAKMRRLQEYSRGATRELPTLRHSSTPTFDRHWHSATLHTRLDRKASELVPTQRLELGTWPMSCCAHPSSVRTLVWQLNDFEAQMAAFSSAAVAERAPMDFLRGNTRGRHRGTSRQPRWLPSTRGRSGTKQPATMPSQSGRNSMWHNALTSMRSQRESADHGAYGEPPPKLPTSATQTGSAGSAAGAGVASSAARRKPPVAGAGGGSTPTKPLRPPAPPPPPSLHTIDDSERSSFAPKLPPPEQQHTTEHLAQMQQEMMGAVRQLAQHCQKHSAGIVHITDELRMLREAVTRLSADASSRHRGESTNGRQRAPSMWQTSNLLAQRRTTAATTPITAACRYSDEV